MAAVLGLWLLAYRRGHPRAPAMVAAMLAAGLAGIAFALPEGVTGRIGLDPASLSHLAQIPGMVLLFVALAGLSRLVPARGAARAPGRARNVGGPSRATRSPVSPRAS